MIVKVALSLLIFSIGGFRHNMSPENILPRVYTLPNCPKCDKLKGWLSEKQIDFDVKPFDTEAQTDFIMRNMFGNPPILELGESFAPSEELFPEEKLDEKRAFEVLGIAKA
jgi:glutaredoxin